MGKCNECNPHTQEICKHLGIYNEGDDRDCDDRQEVYEKIRIIAVDDAAPKMEDMKMPFPRDKFAKCTYCKRVEYCTALEAQLGPISNGKFRMEQCCSISAQYLNGFEKMIKPVVDLAGDVEGLKIVLGGLFYAIDKMGTEIRAMRATLLTEKFKEFTKNLSSKDMQ